MAATNEQDAHISIIRRFVQSSGCIKPSVRSTQNAKLLTARLHQHQSEQKKHRRLPLAGDFSTHCCQERCPSALSSQILHAYGIDRGPNGATSAPVSEHSDQATHQASSSA